MNLNKLTNLEQEEYWIEKWSELYELIEVESDIVFLTSDWREITLDEALGIIQDEAYQDYKIKFRKVWYKGKKALQLY